MTRNNIYGKTAELTPPLGAALEIHAALDKALEVQA